MSTNAVLIARIDERLQALQIKDRTASMRAIGKPDLIRDIRRGKEPLADRVKALASALETTVDFLQGGDPPAVHREAPAIFRAPNSPRNVPVYGTAIGADASFWSEHSGAVAVEQTDLNTGEVLDYLRRPPGLTDRKDIYGLYISGDSMAPKFETGEAVLVDPRQPPAIRDYVVVYLRDKADEFAAAVLIKRLVRRSTDWIELEQFNPPAVFRLDKRQYRAVHRVKQWDEAFGF